MSDSMEPKREKEIVQKLNELNRVVEEVGVATDQIRETIEPVLSVQPETKTGEGPRVEPSCSVAKEVECSVVKLERIRDLLYDAMRRVEV